MAEHVLRPGNIAEIGVFPRVEADDGGRQLVVMDNGETYRIPLPPAAHQHLTRLLSLNDVELAEELERQEARRKLVLSDQNGHAAH